MNQREDRLPVLLPPPGHRRAFRSRKFQAFGSTYVFDGPVRTVEGITAAVLCCLAMGVIIIGLIQFFVALLAIAAALFFPLITLITGGFLMKISFMFSEGKLKIWRPRRG